MGRALKLHWMWWPACGAVVVGIVGLIEPRTLGVGYDNIVGAISGTIAGRALIVLVVLKLVSWSIYLGSGTSGGTLAPLFTIGGGLGAWLGAIGAGRWPALGIDARVAGLVGMAAIFAGASHALLASVVFAFETTRQPVGLLPLLLGCTASYFVALLLNRHSIMTEKLVRRGVSVHTEYSVDYLSRVFVEAVGLRDVVTLRVDMTVHDARTWFAGGRGKSRTSGFPNCRRRWAAGRRSHAARHSLGDSRTGAAARRPDSPSAGRGVRRQHASRRRRSDGVGGSRSRSGGAPRCAAARHWYSLTKRSACRACAAIEGSPRGSQNATQHISRDRVSRSL